MWKWIIAVSIFVINIVLLDAFVVYKYFWSQKVNPSTTSTISQLITPLPEGKECSQQCLDYIDQKIPNIVGPSPNPTSIGGKAPIATPKAKIKSVSYFSVPGSGSTLKNDWTDVVGSDFYFDPAEHPGIVDVRFEVNLRLANGNGTAFARLWDVTHSIAVGGDVTSSSQTSTLTTSDAINFWSGRNQYRVQIKSLTADTAVFESGRLRMVIEQ
jgi:hypothetical protein